MFHVPLILEIPANTLALYEPAYFWGEFTTNSATGTGYIGIQSRIHRQVSEEMAGAAWCENFIH